MRARVIDMSDTSEAKAALKKIGSDNAGIELMAPKAVFRTVKLSRVKPIAANILKQEMLSLGGEVATTYGAINQSVAETDVLILGTLKQYGLLIEKLKLHQFGLPQISQTLDQLLSNYDQSVFKLAFGKRTLGLGSRTIIMGILNVTPDSFSDGGSYPDVQTALARAKAMLEEGADIIDIGGESTRPGAAAVSAEEELARVLPVIEKLSQETGAIISIDTTKARVAREALAAGAQMVNDISGLRFDPDLPQVVAKAGVPVCLMHIKGIPRSMQAQPAYVDLLGEVIDYLSEGLAIAQKAGILHDKIIVDPGIGFGKTVDHNLEIFQRLRELKSLGCPILVGPSRKSLIGQILDLSVAQRLEGTAALVAAAIYAGADLVRVHDVKEMKRVAMMVDAIVRREKNGEAG
ncbi:dihydropteroate synthase [Candidatus Saganbacteria bacterium CG08_land_8_20_14_0_20_45_16]|uniref:Dihydropteroate synthase n=1 Tax=Candidatus Saganbacteria bacterium CG08_land_8_20_14_0_20_45_16 TaxID=2014293 RepID=A0A2H0XZT2_UNCSA|nr:MAG: dihydropteroate synthase [Candidatus Saganbacteria bacterium CG08_land_8_20_14_0_20_45_16]